MADIVVRQDGQLPIPTQVRYRDMGDGTHALVHSVVAVGGGATQYQEDAPSAGGDLGTMALAIRNDAGGSLVSANGDYAPLQVNAAGQLIIAGGAGGTSMADDAPFAPGATQITPMGAMLDDVAPDTVNEGDAGIPRMSANRNLYTRIRDNAGNERGLNIDAGGRLGANIHDGAGAVLTSTLVGADQALDVNIVAGAGAGGTSMVDDAAFTPATTAITPAGAMFDDIAPDSVNEGDAGVVRMSANRNLYTTLRDAAGNERGLNVDAAGAIAVTNAALAVVGGGAEATAQRVTIANDSTGLVSVDDNGGSLTVDGGVTADIRDGAGVALTSTLVGADQSLDVNVVQTVGGAGGTSMVDDAAFTPATTQITPAGAMFDDAAPDSVDEGDAGVVRMSANRNLYATIRDAAGNERGLNVDANNRVGITNPVLSVVGGGVEATAQRVTIANDSTGVLTVDDGGASLTVDNPALSVVGGGAEAAAQRVTIANDSTGVLSVDDGGASLSVDDAGGSLTVDNPALSVVGGGAEATALRVTVANDSTGVLSVDDNAGSLTVDQATHDNLNANANIQVGDADVANGNPVPISDAGGSITIDGTVTIQEPLSVDDNGGSLTVDNAALSVVGGGAEATAQRVTIANDSTGVLSVDDAGGSLTVDGGVTADIRDGAGTALTSTVVGADQALDVNIVQTVGGAGGTSMVDDAAFTPATTQITPAGAMFDDVAPDSVDEGDAGIVRMSANRNLYTTLRDAAGNERGLNVDANNRIGVTNPVLAVVGAGAEATAQRVTIANDSTGVLSVDDGGASLTVDNPALSVVGGGAEATAQRVTIANDSTGLVSVDDAGGSLTVDGIVTADIRDGAGNALTSTLVVADQALDVNIVQTVGGAGGTSMADDAAFTPTTTQVTPVAGFCDETAPDSVDEGDAGAVRMSANRNLNVRIRDDAGNERGLNVDASGDIGITNAALAMIGGGVEAAALRVTIANDSTGLLSVDDNAGSLTVDQDYHDNLQCNANMQIGDVDVAAGNPVPVGVRDGAGVALTSTLVVADQALDVNIVQTVGGMGGTSMADDAAFTPAATQITPAGAMFDDVAPDSVDEGDAGIVRMSANRNLYATIRDAAGNERGLNIDAAGAIAVTNGALAVVGGGAEATALRVTLANDSTGLVSVDDNAGSLTVDNPVLSVVGGGAEATAQRVTIANDSTGLVSVDDGAGSLTVDQATHDNLQCNANVQVGDADVAVGNPIPVAGTAAEDAACAGNPVLLGGRYHASIVAADAVDDGDAVRLLTDSVGGVVRGHRADAWNANDNYAAAQTDAVVKAAPGANLALYVTDILFSTDTAMNIFLEAGAAILTPKVYLAVNGGWSAHFQTPIRWTTNTAITLTSSAAGNHSVLILGYTAP